MTPVEREALHRLAENLRHTSRAFAAGLADIGSACIRAADSFAAFTATVKAEGDGE